jgi:hypothetical protein
MHSAESGCTGTIPSSLADSGSGCDRASDYISVVAIDATALSHRIHIASRWSFFQGLRLSSRCDRSSARLSFMLNFALFIMRHISISAFEERHRRTNITSSRALNSDCVSFRTSVNARRRRARSLVPLIMISSTSFSQTENLELRPDCFIPPLCGS